MKNTIKTRGNTRFFISPLFAVAISLVVFFIAWCFPADIYINLIGEKNYINFDPLSLLFIIVNVIFFLLGYSIVKNRGGNNPVSHRSVLSVPLYLAIPLLISIGLSVTSILLLLKKNPFIVQYLAVGDGFNIKRELDLKKYNSTSCSVLHFNSIMGIVYI